MIRFNNFINFQQIMKKYGDRELDDLYDRIDDYFRGNLFDKANEELKTVDIKNTDITGLIGYLSITLAAHEKLSYRTIFQQEVRKELVRRKEQRIEDLLRGLEVK